MVKILVVDDEEKIRELIRKYAVHEGFEVDEASDGLQAVDACKKQQYDLVIMDIMMPNLDGFSAVEKIKSFDANVPFIMLSALNEEYDRVHGFSLGIDDYVVKPFSAKELMMRIKAILKRVHPETMHDGIHSIGGIVVDERSHIVTVDGKRVNLSPKEYDLLLYFITNIGIALTREQILSTVWGYDFFGDDRTLDTHIKLLRKNLGPYANYIVTLRGVGYRFEKEE